MSDKEIIYVADPMCSWCWGFSPVLAKIRQVAKDKVTVSLLVGGLRAGETNELDDRMNIPLRENGR
ncbi:MAG: hypothetical protein ACE5IR_02840 [bacterium]